jgi:mannose-6-phosphate isomerase
MEVMDFDFHKDYRTKTEKTKFTRAAGRLPLFHYPPAQFTGVVKRDYSMLDSFVIYICTSGRFTLEWENGKMEAGKGETLLLPAIHY